MTRTRTFSLDPVDGEKKKDHSSSLSCTHPPSFPILFVQSYNTTKGCLLSLTPIQHTCPQLCSTSGQMDTLVEQRKTSITFTAAFVASVHICGKFAFIFKHVSDTHARAQVSGKTAKYIHAFVRKHSRVLAGQEIRKWRKRSFTFRFQQYMGAETLEDAGCNTTCCSKLIFRKGKCRGVELKY